MPRQARKVDEKWPDRFVMLTRGWVEEHGLKMSRNAWDLYTAIGTFYNLAQQRAFPTLEDLEAVCSLERFSRSRALGELFELGLTEVWGERKGRRRRTFYRLPYVDAKGHHTAKVQQRTAEQLLKERTEGTLPPSFAWVEAAYLKSRKRVRHVVDPLSIGTNKRATFLL